MRKGGVRGAVPIAAAVVAAVIVAAVLWWAVARALPADISALVVAAGAVLLVAASAAVGRLRESAEPVRVVALGDDRETVQVRFGGGSALMVQGWAYLDRHRGGDPKRPCVAARRVVEFADSEQLTVHAAVAASASALRRLYAEFGFVEAPLGGVRGAFACRRGPCGWSSSFDQRTSTGEFRSEQVELRGSSGCVAPFDVQTVQMFCRLNVHLEVDRGGTPYDVAGPMLRVEPSAGVHSFGGEFAGVGEIPIVDDE